MAASPVSDQEVNGVCWQLFPTVVKGGCCDCFASYSFASIIIELTEFLFSLHPVISCFHFFVSQYSNSPDLPIHWNAVRQVLPHKLNAHTQTVFAWTLSSKQPRAHSGRCFSWIITETHEESQIARLWFFSQKWRKGSKKKKDIQMLPFAPSLSPECTNAHTTPTSTLPIT